MERAQRRYSVELKQRIVEDIEAGQLSVREAARDVQASVPMVHRWLAEYGRYQPKQDRVEVVMKSEQARIAALEKALADAHLQLQVYDALIAQANARYKTDLKKSFGTVLPGSAVPSAPSPSGRSARSSAGPAPRTTSDSSAVPPGARPARPTR